MTERDEARAAREEAEAELADLLYGELDEPAAARVRARVARDPDLERGLAEARQGYELLETLRRESEPTNPTFAPRRRVAAWLAGSLAGAAAGLALFLALVAASTRVERDGDRVSVHFFGAGAGAEPSASAGDGSLEERLAAVLSTELDRRDAELVAQLDARLRSEFHRAALGEERRTRSFLRAIELRRDQDLQAIAGLVRGVAVGAARQDLRTRRALGDVVALVAHTDPVDDPAGTTDTHRDTDKETNR